MQARSPWWLVGGVFVVLTVSSGFGFYNLSVYMNALAGERGFAVADLSGAVALLFLVSGAGGVVVGRLIERYDIRWIMVAGALVGGVALLLLGSAREIWQVWLLYALFGAGNSGVSLVPGTTVVTRWFPGANRSLALSIASTGLSCGGALLTPLSANVIRWMGVDAALPWFGLVYVLAIAPIALLLVRSWPENGEAPPKPPPALDVREVLRTRFFIGATLAYIAIMAAQVGGIAHVFNHVAKVDGHGSAAMAVSLVAGTSMVGRLLGGVVLTAKFPIRLFTLLNIAGQSAGLAAFAFASGYRSVLFASILFGLSLGNLLMLQPLLLAQAFGVRLYPRLFAFAHAASTIGVAGGPLAMGIVHDAFNYAWSFGLATVASILALAILLAAGALPTPAERA